MISTALIKKIELGPRQMTFGFDDNMSACADRVLSFVEKEYQSSGSVTMETLMASDPLTDDIPVSHMLQNLFWLAEELKVHFYVEGSKKTPRQIKQILIQNPDAKVSIATNRPVDTRRFEQVIQITAPFLPPIPDRIDQYGFSRILIARLKQWHDRLKSYKTLAEQPYFPGIKEIRNAILLLDSILEKQDSYSLIQTCLKYRSKLPLLADQMAVLTEFYTGEKIFWGKFADRMLSFESNLAEISKNKTVYPKYLRLKEIFTASYPFPFVDEAQRQLPDVFAFHQQVEEQKLKERQDTALEKTDKMIEKLIALFDTFESEQDYRNRILYDLRALKKKIKNSSCMEEINDLLNDGKDLFVDIIEEI